MKQVTSLTAQCLLLQPGKPSYHSVASSCWQLGWATNWGQRDGKQSVKRVFFGIKEDDTLISSQQMKAALKAALSSFRGGYLVWAADKKLCNLQNTEKHRFVLFFLITHTLQVRQKPVVDETISFIDPSNRICCSAAEQRLWLKYLCSCVSVWKIKHREEAAHYLPSKSIWLLTVHLDQHEKQTTAFTYMPKCIAPYLDTDSSDFNNCSKKYLKQVFPSGCIVTQ